MDKDDLRVILRKGTSVITFTKKDGSERVMKCTLDSDLMPKFESKETDRETKPRPEDPNNIVVWDLEKEGFRKIGLNSIISIVSL
jgi:hypothetical protein